MALVPQRAHEQLNTNLRLLVNLKTLYQLHRLHRPRVERIDVDMESLRQEILLTYFGETEWIRNIAKRQSR
jgi:hypothetical protein